MLGVGETGFSTLSNRFLPTSRKHVNNRQLDSTAAHKPYRYILLMCRRHLIISVSSARSRKCSSPVTTVAPYSLDVARTIESASPHRLTFCFRSGLRPSPFGGLGIKRGNSCFSNYDDHSGGGAGSVTMNAVELIEMQYAP
jgi:hypothetical protein